MAMELQPILAALIVNIILIPSNRGQSTTISNIHAEEKENLEFPSKNSDVQQHFQNLVNSVAKSDMRRSEIYRHVLKQGVAEERRAFGAMKEEMESARSKNGDKRRNSLSDENVLLAKRETKEDRDEKFIEKYGNQLNNSGVWDDLRKAYEDHLWTENVCDQAHKLAKKRPGKIGLAIPYTRKLTFHDSTRHKPMEIDVVVYIIQDYNTLQGIPYFFYLTKGLRSDCVFYLEPQDKEGSTLMLGEHVCGIKT